MFSFIRNLVGVKTDNAVNSAIETIVRWDPKSATEAELRTMEQNLDQLGLQVAQARAALDKERREADHISALSAQRMAAAEQLQHRLDGEANPANKTALEKSLVTLVAMLETMAPDVDREKQDAVDAETFLRSLEETYQTAGQKLRGARSDLDRAAENRAEAALQAAGLSGATSGLSVALKAMQDSAARNLAQAEAANAKASLLKPTKPEQDDPNIAAARAAVSGGAAPTASLGDRLAALRIKQG